MRGPRDYPDVDGGDVSSERGRSQRFLSSRLFLSLLIGVVLWCVFSWPLPTYIGRGIPSSSQNIEHGHVRRMIPGDHLQLLYNFWVAGDMLAGRTPFLHNVYEFNRGRDEDRFEPRHYYVPFSLLFGVIAWLGNRALAWNLVSLFSIWLTYWLTWLLVRRYVAREPVAAVCALVGILLPYRWVNLLGGSPGGFAMTWVPALLLGLDLAVRDGRWLGGLLAGFALLFSRLCDVHVFFFSALVSPCWCVVAWLGRGAAGLRWPTAREWRRLVVALLPYAGLAALALSYSLWRSGELGASKMAQGRELAEVALTSPVWGNFVQWRASGLPSHVYVGFTLPIACALACLALMVVWFRRRRVSWPRLALGGLLLVGVAGIALLALGTNGPGHGKLLLACRKVLPPYAMVRQPAKIFCLLPSLLAVGLAVLVGGAVTSVERTWLRWTVVLLLGLAMAVEYRLQIRPTICLLQNRQGAYQAVADDARESGSVARMMAVPIWPGDSSWTSVPQHFVSLYRIRMLNGYSPVVNLDYFDNVFERFKSVNKGTLTDEQADALLELGIGYVLLHENAFPEKVSPFSVWFTLKRFLNNERLQWLKQDEGVWAFKILPAPEVREPVGAAWDLYGPSRHWAAWDCIDREARPDWREAGRVSLGVGGLPSLETKPTSMGDAPGLRWLVRAKGQGVLQAATRQGVDLMARESIEVQGTAWHWYEVPVKALGRHDRISLRLAHDEGLVDVHMIVLAAGLWQPPGQGRGIDMPAISFFHAGYSNAQDGSVSLRRSADPHGVVFYGPDLPLPPGAYTARLTSSSTAPAGTRLGSWSARSGGTRLGDVAVVAGENAVIAFVQPADLPIRLAFDFTRRADVVLHGVTLTRVSGGRP